VLLESPSNIGIVGAFSDVARTILTTLRERFELVRVANLPVAAERAPWR
jgi:hypothetical protein